MLEEFKKFAMRGNVVDLAVAVIIGAAFGAVVNSLVADIIMPIVGSITGGIDFSNYFPKQAETVERLWLFVFRIIPGDWGKVGSGWLARSL